MPPVFQFGLRYNANGAFRRADRAQEATVGRRGICLLARPLRPLFLLQRFVTSRSCFTASADSRVALNSCRPPGSPFCSGPGRGRVMCRLRRKVNMVSVSDSKRPSDERRRVRSPQTNATKQLEVAHPSQRISGLHGVGGSQSASRAGDPSDCGLLFGGRREFGVDEERVAQRLIVPPEPDRAAPWFAQRVSPART
jgi:hypothetical protein